MKKLKLIDCIETALLIILCVSLMIVAKLLFKSEFSYFFKWWALITALGITFMPLSMFIFGGFVDAGWNFSKIIGISVSGWLVWYLSSVRLFKFNITACIFVLIICLGLNIFLGIKLSKKGKLEFTGDKAINILFSELVFIGMFIIWTYLRGFRPDAYGTTEKLMDYGIMQALFKSDYMPPEDMWLAGEKLNYYYVGLFMSTYLSKFSGVGVEYGYNLMMSVIAAFGFSLPASIVTNVSADFVKKPNKFKSPLAPIFPYASGAFAGIAVMFSGSMHYLIYARFVPWCRVMLGLDKMAEETGYTFPKYWFPEATRYIGYNPATDDKTIHEFPLYSAVLGDLHAHYINIIFVLTVVAVLYAFLQFRKHESENARLELVYREKFKIKNAYKDVFNPCVILVGFFIGLFHMTNFWDFPIYFVVAGAIILFSNAVVYNFSFDTIKLTALHAVVVLVVSKLTCLPFTVNFNQISSKIAFATDHTPFYQILILWGLPLIVLCVYICMLIRTQNEEQIFDTAISKTGRKSLLFRFLGNLEEHDLFILVIGLCGAGLILIPELIYVVDIYSGSYKRANTMFKLTYQAFILLGMVMGYVLNRLLIYGKNLRSRCFAGVFLIILILSTGYFNNSTKAWFGNYTDYSGFKGLSAGNFMHNGREGNLYGYKDEVSDAIDWLNENIEGRPVVLEANGDSYTEYCRVSSATGLPTILGWKTHEWLWQSDETLKLPQIVEERDGDVSIIYTSSNANEVSDLLEQYDVSYIFIGDMEKKKFEINYELLFSLGELVFPVDGKQGEIYDAMILKVYH